MAKIYTYSEKAIGIFLIIFGSVGLFVLFYGLNNLFGLGVTYFHLTWEKVSILKVLKSYHLQLILGALTIFSGLLLLLNRKAGWVLSVITTFVTGILCVINLLYLFFMPAKSGMNKVYIILFDTIIIVSFFFILTILLSQSYKTKYNPTKGSWWAIILVSGLLIIDNIIFNL